MKRILSAFLALVLCAILAVQVSAAQLPRLVDRADLLTANQEAELLSYLDQVSEELQADVVVVTIESLVDVADMMTAYQDTELHEYLDQLAEEARDDLDYIIESLVDYSADDVIEAFYDEYGYGIGPDRDGVMLLLSMAERDYRILSNGFAADAITMSEIDEIGDEIVSELSDGAYMDAFVEFADLCAYEIRGERYGFPFPWGTALSVSVVIGFMIAFIATGIMRAKLKSVYSKTGAREYAKSGSMQLTRSSDLFLYQTLDRRRKPQESSSGSRGGGGGGGRNVGGGKF